MSEETRAELQRPNQPFDLDALYDVEGIAPWLRLSPRTVLQLARRKKIPCVRFNERVLRFHPRSILASRGAKVAA